MVAPTPDFPFNFRFSNNPYKAEGCRLLSPLKLKEWKVKEFDEDTLCNLWSRLTSRVSLKMLWAELEEKIIGTFFWGKNVHQAALKEIGPSFSLEKPFVKSRRWATKQGDPSLWQDAFWEPLSTDCDPNWQSLLIWDNFAQGGKPSEPLFIVSVSY